MIKAEIESLDIELKAKVIERLIAKPTTKLSRESLCALMMTMTEEEMVYCSLRFGGQINAYLGRVKRWRRNRIRL